MKLATRMAGYHGLAQRCLPGRALPRRQSGLVFLLTCLSQIGCDGGSTSEIHFEQNASEPNFNLSPPEVLQTRAIDNAFVEPRVTLNGNPVTLQPSTGTNWRGSGQVDQGAVASISVVWIEKVGARELPLAEYQKNMGVINSNQPVVIEVADYEIDQQDEDGDRISNLSERIGNTDPYDPEDPGANFAQVLVRHIDPADAPEINDGRFDAVWREAQYQDENGARMSINRLMIDRGATRLDGDTEYYWAAMHDGEYLYLLVFGADQGRQTPFGDSILMYDDDAIEIFWDGDNSRASRYDGINDFHMLIPLLGEEGAPNRSDQAGGRMAIGGNSASFPRAAVDWGVNVSSGTDPDLWEVRIRLDEADLEIGRTFGFEVQLDDDLNGGARDVKWGWAHPSRSDSDIDFTYRFPNYMSTARLCRPGNNDCS
ncbi:MAG: sugar-binding protein [Granulosicoccus sp.]